MFSEEEVMRRWWALPLKIWLPLQNREHYQLLFAGRPGGSVGPDVCDAVFGILNPATQSLERCVGDVEFHVRSSDWTAHGHDSDPRYNHVILHVVLICNDWYPTMRQDGAAIPLCSLSDLSPAFPLQPGYEKWPCQEPYRGVEQRKRLLRQAGLQRFEQKAHAFVELLRASPACSVAAWDPYDLCLIPALAEGLGYGRDRAYFRAAGLFLLGLVKSMPDPLGRSVNPSLLDAERLQVLSRLVLRWRYPGVWCILRQSLLMPSASYSNADILSRLRDAFGDLGLSPARASILLVNIILPFALAISLLEHDELLAQRALALYQGHPDLPSNRITRAMGRQLYLTGEVEGSCSQQGLHHIYQESCREKQCELCVMSRMSI